MNSSHIYFGERVSGYDIPVLNEREVRASAGILFLFSLTSFLHAWLIGDFNPIKVFVTVFMLDFIVRVFINPKYSPTLLLGRLFVSHQDVEYVGAAQKRFAWALGLALSVVMFALVVVGDVIGPINLFLCLTCLTLLFFESAFGICIGCRLYGLFYRSKVSHCSGGICEARKKETIQQFSSLQLLILSFSAVLVIGGSVAFLWWPSDILPIFADRKLEPNKDCDVPEWAEKIGHGDMYRLHHGCL